MLTSSFNIWKPEEYQRPHSFGFIPNVHAFLHEDDTDRPAILVVPGGGYGYCSEREGEPVARCFHEAGYQTFVLTYTTNLLFLDPLMDQPLKDIARAVRILRSKAEEFHLIKDRLFVCGFSAGGHLTASLGNYWNTVSDPEYEGISCRPDAMLLCYPVITSGEYTHQHSMEALLGNNPSQELLQHWSMECHVNSDTPPSFVFQTAGDESVPVENSFLMAKALKQAGIPFSYHVFTTGGHGLSISTEELIERKYCSLFTLDPVFRLLEACQDGRVPEADPDLVQEMIRKFEPRRNPDYKDSSKKANHEVSVWPQLADSWLRTVMEF